VKVKIVVRGPAELHDDDFEPIADPARIGLVDGLVGAPGETMSEYFEGDEILTGVGLEGGDLRVLRVRDGSLEVVTEYEAERLLSEEELAALVEFTEGQWSDGMGTHGFYEPLESLGVEGMNISCKPLGSRGKTRIVQTSS